MQSDYTRGNSWYRTRHFPDYKHYLNLTRSYLDEYIFTDESGNAMYGYGEPMKKFIRLGPAHHHETATGVSYYSYLNPSYYQAYGFEYPAETSAYYTHGNPSYYQSYQPEYYSHRSPSYY